MSLCRYIYRFIFFKPAENKTPSNNFLTKIISGGQTGVDRAALKIAKLLGIPHGGWCPYKRNAEDGIIPLEFQLEELPAPSAEESIDPNATYRMRTKLNVENSDGTLIILKNKPQQGTGTLHTIMMAKQLKKPYFIIKLADDSSIIDIAVNWIIKNNIRTLNVAGPRETQEPGISAAAYSILEKLLNHRLLKKNNTEELAKDRVLQAKL